MLVLNTNYDVSYNETDLEVYNQLEEMKDLSKDIEAKSDIKEKTGILDIIGGYFTGAYKVMKLTKRSYNLFDTMSNSAIENTNLGEAGQYLRIAVSTSILIIIILGVLISAIVKWVL